MSEYKWVRRRLVLVKRTSILAHWLREKYFVLNEVYVMDRNYFYPQTLSSALWAKRNKTLIESTCKAGLPEKGSGKSNAAMT